MLKLYFNGGPNPMKVALFLEEAGQEYEAVFVDTSRGEQLGPEFTSLNPNNKVPVLLDDGRAIFDSTAILLHLAMKTKQFAPDTSSPEWPEMLSWLMFVATGLGPYSGQAVHFHHAAPEAIAYARARYAFEAMRHHRILDERLSTRPYILGNSLSIVDMSVWGWGIFLERVLGAGAAAELPHLVRLIEHISARDTARRARDLVRQAAWKPAMAPEANKHLFRYMEAGAG